MTENDFEVEFYTQEELNVLDRMKYLSNNNLDDDEIYEIYIQNGRNETLTKHEVEKIVEKMKQQDYQWNVVANTKDGKQLKQQEERHKLKKENQEKVTQNKKPRKFRDNKDKENYKSNYTNSKNYFNNQMENNYYQYSSSKYNQNKPYYNNYSNNNYYSNNKGYNQNNYYNDYAYSKGYDKNNYGKREYNSRKNNKYGQVVVKELDYNNNYKETNEEKDIGNMNNNDYDDYQNSNEQYDLEPTQEKNIEDMVKGLTDDKSIEIDTFFAPKDNSNSKRPETGKRKEVEKQGNLQQLKNNEIAIENSTNNSHKQRSNNTYPHWESSFHNLKEINENNFNILGHIPQNKQNNMNFMMNNNDMFLQFLQFQQFMSQVGNMGMMGMNDHNMNMGFNPNSNVFLPQNQNLGLGNTNKFNNMSKK